ncbi:MAG: class I SAM-dependent methyltransferase [Oscillospiraceae bacterium]
MDIKASIRATREGFEQSFSSGNFYNKQTQDATHLEQIMRFLPIKDGMRILDLGTGSGYMSFPIAQSNASCKIIGLDIVLQTLAANRVRAAQEGLRNLSFMGYDGLAFPFETNSFDMVITRYALHHFPDIAYSISEVARVLQAGGRFFISDPCPNDCDKDRFVDAYMQLKKDGHIKFYTEDEWRDICGTYGMELTASFQSKIRFPKKKETAYGYEDVLKNHDRRVIESYHLMETEDELYITLQVNNLMFLKTN